VFSNGKSTTALFLVPFPMRIILYINVLSKYHGSVQNPKWFVFQIWYEGKPGLH